MDDNLNLGLHDKFVGSMNLRAPLASLSSKLISYTECKACSLFSFENMFQNQLRDRYMMGDS
jgi:hypothetical protein